VRKADNLPPSCADVKKSGGLNLLEPCGPVQACNGTVLLYHVILGNRFSGCAFMTLWFGNCPGSFKETFGPHLQGHESIHGSNVGGKCSTA
jgi:hypothetical protein